jgi:hypothetical protein
VFWAWIGQIGQTNKISFLAASNHHAGFARRLLGNGELAPSHPSTRIATSSFVGIN